MKRLLVIILALISSSQLIAVIVENRTGRDLIARVEDSGIGSDTISFSDIIIWDAGKGPFDGKGPFKNIPAETLEIRYKGAYNSPTKRISNVKEDDHIIIKGNGVSTLEIAIK